MDKNMKCKLAINVIGEHRNVRRYVDTNTHMQVTLVCKYMCRVIVHAARMPTR